MHVTTPSTTSRLPTIDFAISARSVSIRFRKSVTCSRTASTSVMSGSVLFSWRPEARGKARVPGGRASLLFAWPDQLEVPLHVEAIPAGDLVLREGLLGD